MTTTRNKRSSAIHVTLPWRGMLPAPDGTIGDADRQHVPYMYAGIEATEVFAEAELYIPERVSVESVYRGRVTQSDDYRGRVTHSDEYRGRVSLPQ